MKRILILLALSLFWCSTASAIQGGGGEATKNPKPTPKPRPPSAAKPKVEPHKRSSPPVEKDPRVAAIEAGIAKTTPEAKQMIEKLKAMTPEVNEQVSAQSLAEVINDYANNKGNYNIKPIGWEASQKSNQRWKLMYHCQDYQGRLLDAEWEYNPETNKLYPFENDNAAMFWASTSAGDKQVQVVPQSVETRISAPSVVSATSSGASSTPPTNVNPKWLEGVWEGAAYQINTRTTWAVKLTVQNNAYSVEYPSLSCGGEWILVEKGLSRAKFKETITYGVDRCVNDGEVTIERISDTQVASKYTEPNSTVVMASSILSRK